MNLHCPHDGDEMQIVKKYFDEEKGEELSFQRCLSCGFETTDGKILLDGDDD